jgi:hypothetical protein
MSNTTSDVIWAALAAIPTLDEADAAAAIDALIAGIARALQRDPRMRRLTFGKWELLLADAAARGAEELSDLIVGKIDVDEAAEAVTEALALEAVKEHVRKQAGVEMAP